MYTKTPFHIHIGHMFRSNKNKRNRRLEERRSKTSQEVTDKVDAVSDKADEEHIKKQKEDFRRMRSGGGIPLGIV